MPKLAVIGSRDFADYELFKKIIGNLLLKYPSITEFVSGGARGADKMAEQYEEDFGFPKVKLFIPDWKPNGVYDRTAGFKRNREIWEYADFGIAFWDGKSKGTADSFEIVEEFHKNLIVFNYIDDTIKLLEFSKSTEDW